MGKLVILRAITWKKKFRWPLFLLLLVRLPLFHPKGKHFLNIDSYIYICRFLFCYLFVLHMYVVYVCCWCVLYSFICAIYFVLYMFVIYIYVLYILCYIRSLYICDIYFVLYTFVIHMCYIVCVIYVRYISVLYILCHISITYNWLNICITHFSYAFLQAGVNSCSVLEWSDKRLVFTYANRGESIWI